MAEKETEKTAIAFKLRLFILQLFLRSTVEEKKHQKIVASNVLKSGRNIQGFADEPVRAFTSTTNGKNARRAMKRPHPTGKK